MPTGPRAAGRRLRRQGFRPLRNPWAAGIHFRRLHQKYGPPPDYVRRGSICCPRFSCPSCICRWRSCWADWRGRRGRQIAHGAPRGGAIPPLTAALRPARFAKRASFPIFPRGTGAVSADVVHNAQFLRQKKNAFFSHFPCLFRRKAVYL